jgi:hypothetical protein
MTNATTNLTPLQDSASVSLRNDRSLVPDPSTIDRDKQSRIIGSTGPRSEEGKQRSSKNAIKSGIFAQATLLKEESLSDYQSLLEGIWDVLKPEGKLEELLVEKLASISWRYRRLLAADGAAFQRNSRYTDSVSKSLGDTGELDRLVRYESNLERAFDRTLTQLERIRRVRSGEPLPPQLDIKIS